MSDYYTILGVSTSASQAEIRQAYRQLVQVYHPDVNPDPSALQAIQLINEAYDVIGDPKRRAEYDYARNNPFVSYEPPQPQHRDPAYRRRGYRPPSKPKEDPEKELMRNAISYVGKVAWSGIFVCIFLLIDFLLPSKIHTETITSFEVFRTSHVYSMYIVTDTGRKLNVGDDKPIETSVGDKLNIHSSQLLEVVKFIESEDGKIKTSSLATMYTNFAFVPVLLFLLSLVTLIALWKDLNLEFKFNIGLVTFIILIFVVIMMLS